MLAPRHDLRGRQPQRGQAEGLAVAGQHLRAHVGDADVPKGIQRRVEDGTQKSAREAAMRDAGRSALQRAQLLQQGLGAHAQVLEVLRVGCRDGVAVLVYAPGEGVTHGRHLGKLGILHGAELNLLQIHVHLEGHTQAEGRLLGDGLAAQQGRAPHAVRLPGNHGLDGLHELPLPRGRELHVLAAREEPLRVGHRLWVAHHQDAVLGLTRHDSPFPPRPSPRAWPGPLRLSSLFQQPRAACTSATSPPQRSRA